MPIEWIICFAAAILCAVLAVLVFFRQKGSFVHQLFAAGMAAFSGEAILNGLSVGAFSAAEVESWQRFRLSFTAFIPVWWVLFSYSFGRIAYKESLLKKRWYILVFSALPVLIVAGLSDFLFSGPPIAEHLPFWAIPLGWAGYLFYLLFLMNLVLIVMNLERTLRNSTGSIRYQIKFMILGLGGIFAIRIFTVSQVILYRSVEMWMESLGSGVLILGGAAIILSLLRLRVLNIDIYLSTSFIYNSITVSIIGIYLLAVGILAKLVSDLEISYPLILEDFFIFLAVFGAAVILLSNRLREAIKRFISLHLKRPKYDYQKIWEIFSEKTASLAGIREICSVVSSISAETFGSACATIWLADPSQEALVLGGSTVFSPNTMPDFANYREATAQFVRRMREQHDPVDFDEKERHWAGELKRTFPAFFEAARIRYAVPLRSGSEFLGVLTLDEKITKENFSWEDSGLLRAIAGQAAVCLLRIKMSQQLSAAKEMEAFKTMSAFFLHDLKNLASKLSLTMESLPVHYHNQEFRNDALKAIADSLGKINKMCGGLSLLRQEIALQEVEGDLNELVISTLGKLNGSKAAIVQDLQPLPKVSIDVEQMQKVLTNLILNAYDAVENGGEIRVATGQKDGWAVLSVSDNGCGIPQEFIEKSLFRPFKTTKKKGMGIGLYHSKTIVEAHRGRIEVESEIGKGTTFRVYLPTTKESVK